MAFYILSVNECLLYISFLLYTFQNAPFYNEYRPMLTNAKDIAVKKDVKALEELCSTEVFSWICNLLVLDCSVCHSNMYSFEQLIG